MNIFCCEDKRPVVEVGIGRLAGYGDAECEMCGKRLIKGFPTNYPQVCRPCADEYVWQFSPSRRRKVESPEVE